MGISPELRGGSGGGKSLPLVDGVVMGVQSRFGLHIIDYYINITDAKIV